MNENVTVPSVFPTVCGTVCMTVPMSPATVSKLTLMEIPFKMQIAYQCPAMLCMLALALQSARARDHASALPGRL